MKTHLSKRLLACFLALCFVLGQVNLPGGLIKIDWGFLHANAAGTTFNATIKGTGNTKGYKVTYEIIDTSKKEVAVTNFDVNDADYNQRNAVMYLAEPDKGTVTNDDDGLTYTVTKVNQNACADFGFAVALVIPKTVKSIGNQAFKGMSNLKTITFEKGTVCSSIGDQAFSDDSSLGSTSANSIYDLEIPATISTVGKEAFKGCKKLKRVTFNGSTTEIGNSAFSGDNELTSVKLPANANTIGTSVFENCFGLTAANIPTKLTAIPDMLFKGCSSYKTVDVDNFRKTEDDADSKDSYEDALVLPAAITSIGTEAFYSNAFASFEMPSELSEIKDNAFQNCTNLYYLKFNSKLKTLGDYAFESCSTLGGKIEIENGKKVLVYYMLTPSSTVTSIGEHAFENCTNLGAFRFGSNPQIKTIGNYAFKNSGLVSFSLPDSITEINEGVFSSCSNFKMLSISRNLTTIGDKAFLDSTQFGKLQTRASAYTDSGATDSDESVEESNPDNDLSYSKITSIGVSAFENTALSKFDMPKGVTEILAKTFNNCQKLETFTFNGDDLTAIYANAFSNCSNLKAITLPNGQALETLSANAFLKCTSLTKFIFGSNNTLTQIDKSTFQGCSSLKNISLPDSVTEIGDSAFQSCSSLTNVDIAKLSALGSNAFCDCTKFTGFNGTQVLTIPDAIKTLGGNVFKNCSSISTITSTGGLTSIPQYTFAGCTALNNVTLGSNITTINASAFENAPITSIEFKSLSAPKTFGDKAFTFVGSYATVICYANLQNSIKELFKGIGIEGLKFETSSRPPVKVYQAPGTDTITNLTITKTIKKYEGTDYAVLDKDGNPSTSTLSWISSNTDVAKVTPESKDGKYIEIVGTGIGSATITGTCQLADKTMGTVTYNVYISPSTSNTVANPYTKFTLTDTTDSTKPKTIATNDSSEEMGYDAQLYFDGNIAKSKIFSVNNLATENLVATTTDNFYWSISDNTACTISPYGDSETLTINGKTYIVGTQAEVTPKTPNTSVKLTVSTASGNSINKTFKTGYAVTALERGNEVVYNANTQKNVLTISLDDETNVQNVNYIVKNPTNAIEALEWSLADPTDTSILTVDTSTPGSCYLKGNALGTATLIAKSSFTGKTITYEVHVTNPIIAPEISDAENNTYGFKCFPNETLPLTVNFDFKKTTKPSDDELVYSFEDPTMAEVVSTKQDNSKKTATVTIKGLKPGTAKLLCNSVSGKFLKAVTITIKQPIEALSVNAEYNTKLAINDTKNLKTYLTVTPASNYIDTYEFESQNTSIATVDAKTGKVTAVALGDCVVRAICKRTGIHTDFNVNVINPATKGTFTPEAVGDYEHEFYPGQTTTISLKAIGKDPSSAVATGDITWKTDSDKVISISNATDTSVTITALAIGSDSITAYNSFDEVVGSVGVVVSKPRVKLEKSEITLYTKIKTRKTYQIKPIIGGVSKTATYSSSKKKVATVSASGKVTAKAKGTTIITIKANGAEATLKITVDTKTKAKPTVTCSAGAVKKNKITVKKKDKTLIVYGGGNWMILNKTFKSSKKSVISINKTTGEAKLKKKGTAKITVSIDGIKKSLTVKVK